MRITAKVRIRSIRPNTLLSPQAMIAYLRQTLASPTYRVPVLPAVAIELMRLTRLPQVRVADVRQVLERDPLLAAKVLQLTQSALYSRIGNSSN
jgi:HD-like signal output (HDOD) protein